MKEVQKKVTEYHEKLEGLVQNNLFKKNSSTFLQMQVFAASYLRFELATVENVELNNGFGPKGEREETTAMVVDAENQKFVTKTVPEDGKLNAFGHRILDDEGDGKKYAFSADHSVFQFVAPDANGIPAKDKRDKNMMTKKPVRRGTRYFALDREKLFEKSHGPNLAYLNMPYWMNNVFQGTTEKTREASWPPSKELMDEVTSHIDEVLEWRKKTSNTELYWDAIKAMAKRKKTRKDGKVEPDVPDDPEKDKLLEFYDLASSSGSGVSQWTMCQGYKMNQKCWEDVIAEGKQDAAAAWDCIEGASTSVPSIHFQSFLRIDVKKFVGTDTDGETKKNRLDVLDTVLTTYLLPFVEKYAEIEDGGYVNAYIQLERAKRDYERKGNAHFQERYHGRRLSSLVINSSP